MRPKSLFFLPTFFILATLCFAPTAMAKLTPNHPPREITEALPDAKIIGRGPLTFFTLLVYEAKLWANPPFLAEKYADTPLALELTYARKLEGALIAERSLVEMQRVAAFSEADAKSWLQLMQLAFPDVKPNDRLVGVFNGQDTLDFYYNGTRTNRVVDRAFATRFIGIWLDPKTSEPRLRQALINANSP